MCAPTKGNRKILGTNTPLFTKDIDSPMIGWTKYYIYLLRRRGCENDFSYVVFPRTIPTGCSEVGGEKKKLKRHTSCAFRGSKSVFILSLFKAPRNKYVNSFRRNEDIFEIK